MEEETLSEADDANGNVISGKQKIKRLGDLLLGKPVIDES